MSIKALPDSIVPPNLAAAQLNALAVELLRRRDHILEAWRAYGEAAGGERSPASSLSRAQFNDHIPAVLDCLGHTIQASLFQDNAEAADRLNAIVCEHGLQRWQQGYQLRELVREWGYLQMSVAEELEQYASAHPELEPRVMATARRVWTQLCADGVAESATQYWHLHQTESAGHVNDLEKALAALRGLELARAEAWRNAAHDLRGSVTVVKGATTLLKDDAAPLSTRAEATDILNKSVSSLHEMLDDLLSLARLEAGQEQREITDFDAAVLIRDFCTASQAAATDRGLVLKMDGPNSLPVQGDRTKVLRILQNLLLNALKYTQRGGVSVTWGPDRNRETDRWTFSVQDTGPGIDENNVAPFAHQLHEATTVADDALDAGTGRRRDIAPAATLRSVSPPLPNAQQPGEGVGLSIVKRLCELLDAGLELATKPGHGTTLRVTLPRSYEN